MKHLYHTVRAAFRFLRFALIILVYFINATVIFYTTQDSVVRRKKLSANSQKYCRLMLKAFNVEVICNQKIDEDENSLVVGNHVGFIDIVALQSVSSAIFITSLEMKNTPVLGRITELGACTYVDRKNRMNIHKELEGITEVLKEGFRVVLYAESVASNGEQVLPFKKTLIMSAAYAQKPIRPFVFNYVKVNGQPVTFEQRDSLCWYGDQTFLPAIWRSLHLDSVVCQIDFLPLVYPSQDSDRTTLSQQLHKIVSDRFIPFTPSMNLNQQARQRA